MPKLINLFKKEKKLPPCPCCGKEAVWDYWIIVPKNEVSDREIKLSAIRCSAQPWHCCSTSYWRIEEQAVYEWRRICAEHKPLD